LRANIVAITAHAQQYLAIVLFEPWWNVVKSSGGTNLVRSSFRSEDSYIHVKSIS